MEHRLLWAEAIDRDRTAIVLQCGDKLIGGVAKLVTLEMTTNYGGLASTNAIFKFVFDWYEVVNSIDAFRRAKRWQNSRQSPFQVSFNQRQNTPRKEVTLPENIINFKKEK